MALGGDDELIKVSTVSTVQISLQAHDTLPSPSGTNRGETNAMPRNYHSANGSLCELLATVRWVRMLNLEACSHWCPAERSR